MIIGKNRHINELAKLFRSSEAVTAEELASSNLITNSKSDFPNYLRTSLFPTVSLTPARLSAFSQLEND